MLPNNFADMINGGAGLNVHVRNPSNIRSTILPFSVESITGHRSNRESNCMLASGLDDASTDMILSRGTSKDKTQKQ